MTQWKLSGIESHTSGHGENEEFIRISHDSGCVLLLPRGNLRSTDTHVAAAKLIRDALNAAG
jgi:hypothetical protein